MNGTMIYKDKNIEVTDVTEGYRLDRGGWWATSDADNPLLRTERFYPARMFEFVPKAKTSAPTRAAMFVRGRKSGKTHALIDALLDQANERGIEVKIVEPVSVTSELGRTALDAAMAETWRPRVDALEQRIAEARRELGGLILQEGQDGGAVDPSVIRADNILSGTAVGGETR